MSSSLKKTAMGSRTSIPPNIGAGGAEASGAHRTMATARVAMVSQKLIALRARIAVVSTRTTTSMPMVRASSG